MKALILAAGYATRLYPLTKDFPKPLLEVGQRPLIDYIVEKLAPLDVVDEIIVVTNSKFIAPFQKWVGGLKVKKPVTLVDDLTKTMEDKRGAIGDMYFTVKDRRIQDDLLVIGGDNLFDDDLGKFLDFTRAKNPSPVIGVYDIKDKKQASKYGVIELDAQNRITDFQEKPEQPKSALVAMCLYYFAKEKLSLIQEYVDSKSSKNDATGFYINWLSKKEAVYGFVFTGRWYDVGDRHFYSEAKNSFNQQEEK